MRRGTNLGQLVPTNTIMVIVMTDEEILHVTCTDVYRTVTACCNHVGKFIVYHNLYCTLSTLA